MIAIEKWWLRTPLAVRWGYIATAIWIAAIFLLKGLPERCPGTDAVSLLWVWEWFGSCRPANEIGDFLAGAFAPVAFMWLVIAVLVQAAELRAQREELAETREEFKLNREVAAATREEIAAQARSAAANVKFLEQQTKIQQAQMETANLANAVASCEATIAVIGEHIQLHLNRAAWHEHATSSAGHFYVAPASGVQSAVQTIVLTARRMEAPNGAAAQSGNPIFISGEVLRDLADLHVLVDEQVSDFDSRPRPVQQRLQSARVTDLHHELVKLLQVVRAN